jgi:arylsulfatase A-like enzyme/tetratricopeptide (TPR) repeat protein
MRISKWAKISVVIGTVALLGASWYFFHFNASKKTEIRNVVLISMDTTRADALSCYGFKYKTTPNIDALANEGVLFENTYSPISLTMPAHSTMLTGMIPPAHGVHDNMSYQLPASNETLAEILKKEGFVTGGIISSFVLDSQFALDQGFDYYNDDFTDPRSPLGFNERLGGETAQCAMQWLEEHQDEKMFMFIHFYDPHRSYNPPDPYKTMFYGSPPPEPNSLEHLQAHYAGELAYTDDCIGRVIDTLKKLEVYDSTLIIVTGDHGEMFYQHGEVTHGYFIYQGNVRVPLVIKVPGQPEPLRIKNTVGIVDIVPTICSLLNIETPLKFQGQDISPYFVPDGPVDLKRHIYCESLAATKYKGNSLLGIVNDQYKYIQTTRPELYDIVEDPMESINLVSEEPHRARLLQDRLKQILEETVVADGLDNKTELDNETLAKLESLGYVSGDVVEDFEFDQSKTDPKDLIEYHSDTSKTMGFLIGGEYEKAREKCLKMIADQPDLYKPYFNLAGIANLEGDTEGSIKYLKQAIVLEPENATLHAYLSDIYYSQKKYELAITHLNKSIEIDSEQYKVHGKLATVYYDLEDYQNSFKHLQESLRIKPEQPAALNKLATLYSRRNQIDQAITCYEKSLDYRSEQPSVIHELAMILWGQGRINEAVDQWEGAMEIATEHVDSLNALAWIKATSKSESLYDPEKALPLANSAVELCEGKRSDLFDTLAAAYAANGDFENAVKTVNRGIELAKELGQEQQIREFQKHLEMYKAGKALR